MQTQTQTQSRTTFTSRLMALVACALFVIGADLQAQDAKVDPTGKWTWSREGRDGGEARVSTLTLKKEGDKLMGKLTTPGRGDRPARESEIEEGTIKGDEISFVINREFNGNQFSMKYVGKVSADTIKGNIQFGRDGETRTRPWEAKRVTESKKQ